MTRRTWAIGLMFAALAGVAWMHFDAAAQDQGPSGRGSAPAPAGPASEYAPPGPAGPPNGKLFRYEARTGGPNPSVQVFQGAGGGFGGSGSFEVRMQPEMYNDIRKATNELHDAKDEDDKAKAEKKLTELLNKYFDDDMKRREDELAKVEAQVKKLRETLEKRLEKRREITDLQMKVLLNEADGLGFFNNAMPPGQPGMPILFTNPINAQENPFGAPAPGGYVPPQPPRPPKMPRAPAPARAGASSGATFTPSREPREVGGGGGGFGGRAVGMLSGLPPEAETVSGDAAVTPPPAAESPAAEAN